MSGGVALVDVLTWCRTLAARVAGIDTAFDYYDQGDIQKVLAQNPHIAREEIFILTKVGGSLA